MFKLVHSKRDNRKAQRNGKNCRGKQIKEFFDNQQGSIPGHSFYAGMRKVMHRLTLQEKSSIVDEDLFKTLADKIDCIYQTGLGE